MSANLIKPFDDSIEPGLPINEDNLEKLTGLTGSKLLGITGLLGLVGTYNITSGEVLGAYPTVRFIVEYGGIEISLMVCIDTKIVYFSNIRIKSRSNRRKQKGTTLLSSQVKFASLFGLLELRGTAIPPNGFISWAKLGYVMYYKDDIIAFDEFMNSKKSKNKKNPMPEHLTARDLNELVASFEGTKLWKREGREWLAKFDLENNSISRKILANYLSKKNLLKRKHS